MKLKKLLSYFKPKPWEKDAVIVLLFIALIGITINSIYTAEITTNAVREMREARENYTSISKTAGKYTEEGNRLFELAHIEYGL